MKIKCLVAVVGLACSTITTMAQQPPKFAGVSSLYSYEYDYGKGKWTWSNEDGFDIKAPRIKMKPKEWISKQVTYLKLQHYMPYTPVLVTSDVPPPPPSSILLYPMSDPDQLGINRQQLKLNLYSYFNDLRHDFKLNVLDARISKNKQNIDTISKHLLELGTYLDGSYRMMEQNTHNINKNTHNINKLSKELQTGLANQSALSMLVQPNGVGKTSVSAAVGGYRDKTALAIGVGSRITDRFTAKAGVAFNTYNGGMSYGASVGYEF
ncbi:YadA C-terminal domain-containing protein [[Haemophilus] ducreyi]|uniref:DsrA n=4 Tax=Haemophilus ducreyi TaxID=730 RepID=A0A0D3QFC1_HAEDC|nr:YadA C-terminal domain-containing protein [[Haemophilus] ducreyi]AJE76458.1 DsrA [[Haemophilus] ducreyi]AJE76459.1 DsrA [[Haemophilus] ducreyi]